MAIVFESWQWTTRWQESARKRREILLILLAALVSAGVATLVLALGVAAIAIVVGLLAIMVIVACPRYGLYLVFALALLFDGGGDQLMEPGRYLDRSLQETLGIPGGIFMPIEVLLLFVVIAWLAGAAVRSDVHFEFGSLGRPTVLFAVALLAGAARGLIAGAQFNFMLWESRFLFGMVLCYVLATNLIRNRAHVRTLLGLIVVCVCLSAIDAVWRKFTMVDAGLLGTDSEGWYQHDDAVVWGLLIMLAFAQLALGGSRWMRALGPAALLLTVFAMLISERRAAYIGVMVAFAAFAAVLFIVRRKAFMLLALPVLAASIVYFPLFWNNTGTFGQPARAVRSLTSPDPRDAASNLWRDLEAINVRATIASDPLIGVGFGQPFLQVVTVPSIAFFEFWNYESHHDVLWVWMKTGAGGFILFFVLLTAGLARSAWIVKSTTDPDVRVFAVVSISAILMSATFCYVDLGLTGNRIPTILGVMLGTVGVLDRLDRRRSDSRLLSRFANPGMSMRKSS